MVNIKLVTEFDELVGIKTLQAENLYQNISLDEALQQGFLSAEYSLDFLQLMHKAAPSIIVKDGDKVVGYALVTLKEVGYRHDLLRDLIDTIDKIIYNGQLLKCKSYVVVGQLCVAKDYRGQGLAKKLYALFRETLYNSYSYCITDVATNNIGSLKTHVSTGFKVIDSSFYGGVNWNIVLWDWTAAH